MPRALVIATCFAPLIAFAWLGCGNDFDGLFDQGATQTQTEDSGPTPSTKDSSSTTPTPVEDSGPVQPATDAAKVDARVACTPIQCGPGVATHTCANGNDDCTNTCTGCGCTCGRQNCGDNDSNTCDNTCGENTTCDIDCVIDGACTFASHGAALAKFRCADDDSTCNATCDQGGACELTCEADENGCAVTCKDTSKCLIQCRGNDQACGKLTLNCESGQKTVCPGGKIVVCNRDCP